MVKPICKLSLLVAISAPCHAFNAFVRSSLCHNGRRVGATRLHETEGSKNNNGDDKRLKVVVVGGGWAGYTVAESLSTNNVKGGSDNTVDIILLDAAKAKGGLAGGYRSATGRPVEAGIHGFWREYRNTFDAMEGIEGVEIDDVLGDYSPSVLHSKSGKVAVAPVLLEEGEGGTDDTGESGSTSPRLNDLSEQSIRRAIAANLPPPLDLPVLAELDNFNSKGTRSGGSKLSLIDLASGLGLLGAWADFEQESRASWERYDARPASLLFEKAGVADALYEELVSPLLHVLPMCPAYDCSAAAALSCFHVFALQSRGAFDVRWCRGSIGERIFDPWQRQLEGRGATVRGGSRVSLIEKREGGYTVRLESSTGGDEKDAIDCDAVVLAVGATAAGKLASSSPDIASLNGAKDFDKLRGVTCVAVRLFLKPNPTITGNLKGGSYDKTQLPPDVAKAMCDSPITVCGAGIGGIVELEETGFCVYDLQRMHDEFSVDYYAANVEEAERVGVLEVDFYRANSFVDMSDEDIVDLALRAVAATFDTAKIASDDIVDAVVLRARNAVSHFAPKSALYSPDVKLGDGMYICGDWVDRTGHASWSTEKAVVTGRQAASALSKDFGLKESQCNVIPAAKDTPQLSALRQSTRVLRSILPPKTLPPSPWVFAKQLLLGDTDP